MKRRIILGIFTDIDKADNAIDTLKNAGYQPKEVPFVMKDVNSVVDVKDNMGSKLTSGILSGVLSGSLLGSAAGLLIGLNVFSFPGIDNFLLGGNIASSLGFTGLAGTFLTGAITGGLAGGLIGGITGITSADPEADYYEEEIKKGAILIAVPVSRGGERLDATNILKHFSCDQIKEIKSGAESKIILNKSINSQPNIK